MAITKAQQVRQMLNGGGAPSNRGDIGKDEPSLGVSLHGGESVKDAVRRGESKAEAKRQERERQKLRQELLMTPVGRNRPLGPLSRFNANVQRNMNIKLAKKRADDLYSRLENYVVGDTDMDYDFSGAPVGLATLTSNKGTPLESTRPNLYTVNPKASVSALQTLLSATRPDTQVTLQNTLDKARDYTSLVNDAKNMTNQEIKDALTELQNRGKTPDQINPVRDDGPEPIIPVDTTFAETPVDEEDYYASVGGNPFTGEGLRLAFRADGGRAGFQEGGIMPRLNQLGSGVSSAEQMLQGINQRLESAESSLGGGGEQMAPGFGTRPNLNVMIDPSVAKDLADQPQQAFQGGIPAPEPQRFSSYEEMMSQRMTKDVPAFFTDLEGVQRRPDGSLFEPKFGELPTTLSGNQFSQVTPPQTPVAMQTPISGIPAAGYADGGNVVGGEYDFESARQMYGLGKLVKKVTRTVKKIAKSPIGKAAIIGAGIYGLGGGFGAGGFKFGNLPGASFFGKGSFNPLLRKVGGDFAQSAFGSMISGIPGGGVTAAIAGTSLLAGLLTAKQEEEAQELSRGEGIDIEAARRSILARAQGNVAGDLRATAFLAEGGKPEPVAKKTMPLLDMGGQEMDLRAEGGFVPIGRMEKADDVPARLSKNEFVFTADAVRNAGDGDVDKGAEVMYNMMKNLEAGGDVSEESQGLEGARKMFQTSQRLEEVL